jgi:hypothetical protein
MPQDEGKTAVTLVPDEDRLRRVFRSLSKDAVFGEQCPGADRLWSGARGELPPADVQALALHLAECGACAEAWRVARQFGTPAELAAPAAGAAGFTWWLAAAAAIAIAAGATLYVRQGATVAPKPVAPPAFAMAVEKAPVAVSSRYALTWRGPNDGQQFLAALKTALDPYERGDYAAAITALTAITTQYRDTMEPAFYLGVSHLLGGSATTAIAELERARDLADQDRHEEVTWYLAAALERAGRRTDAQRFAQSVCDGQGPRAASGCAAVVALRRQP